jgi:hypothetical protein
MGSRYTYIVLLVWLEHHLTRGDYRRPDYRDPRGDPHRTVALRGGRDG